MSNDKTFGSTMNNFYEIVSAVNIEHQGLLTQSIVEDMRSVIELSLQEWPERPRNIQITLRGIGGGRMRYSWVAEKTGAYVAGQLNVEVLGKPIREKVYQIECFVWASWPVTRQHIVNIQLAV